MGPLGSIRKYDWVVGFQILTDAKEANNIEIDTDDGVQVTKAPKLCHPHPMKHARIIRVKIGKQW